MSNGITNEINFISLIGNDPITSPRSTFHQARHPLCARLLTGLKGIRLPLGPPAAINVLDPRAPSVVASPLLD
jgi:hypothetical protein